MLNVWINLNLRDTKSTTRYQSLFSMCILQRVMDIKIYKLVFCTMENTASQKLRGRCILAGAVDTICFR